MRRILSAGVLIAVATVLPASPSSATIHPLVQSLYCAADAAWDNVAVADPPGQTPTGFTYEIISVTGTTLTVAFPEPLTFRQSDFRALIATGFIDEIVRNADGDVTAVLVDLTSIPNAGSGQGGTHCRA
ncbi:MAG: hypothetical protein H0V49_10980 [Nocardioidaceae bacterium]|nr:hypothetical protein [Nocardioidaceae bacterium]